MLLALVRVGGIDPFHRKKDDSQVDIFLMSDVLKALQRFQWDTLSEEQRLELLASTDPLQSLRPAGRDEREARADATEPALPGQAALRKCHALRVARLSRSADVAAKTLAKIAAAPTQEEQIDYVKSLRVLKTGWTLEQRKQYFTWFRKAGGFSGGMSFGGFLAIIKKDAVGDAQARRVKAAQSRSSRLMPEIQGRDGPAVAAVCQEMGRRRTR